MENKEITVCEVFETKVLVLSKPVDINGVAINELKYDFEAMTAWDKQQASKEFKKAGNMISVQELDSDYHLYLFAAAVKKVDSEISIHDILRISARDSAKAEALVRDFFFLSSEDSLQTNTSMQQ